MAARWHVLISHAPADRDRVRAIAERLLGVGIPVALEEWAAGSEPGVGSSRRREGSWSELLLISPTALAPAWSPHVAHKLLQGASAGRRRLVPLLVGAVDELPAPLRSRPWLDFRDPVTFDDPQRLWALVAALRGERADVPPPPEWPVSFDAGGARASLERASLRVTSRQLVLQLGDREIVEPLDAGRVAAMDELAGVSTGSALGVYVDLGARLPAIVLSGACGRALAEAASAAAQRGDLLDLGLELDHAAWRGLPWESLRELDGAPGESNALGGARALAVRRVHAGLSLLEALRPGLPLDVVVVVATPNPRHGAARRVDPNRALAVALEVVEPAVLRGPVRIRLLECVTLGALRQALEERRPHVLLLVAAVRRCELMFAHDDGREVRLAPARIPGELWSAGVPVPMTIVARAPETVPSSVPPVAERAEMAELAHVLARAGAPVVVTLSESPGDGRLVARMLAHVACDPAMTPSRALARARAEIRSESPVARGSAVALDEESVVLVEPPLAWPIASRSAAAAPAAERAVHQDPGAGTTWVGRRNEIETLLRALRSGEYSGCWITGEAGIGKSALARTVAQRLAADRWLVVEVARAARGEPLMPEDVIEALGTRLLEHTVAGYERDDPEAEGRDPLAVLARVAKRVELPWRERWDRLTREIAGRVPVVVLLDDLGAGAEGAESELQELLESWPREAGAPRLVASMRSAIPVSALAARRFEVSRLTRLGPAESAWLRVGLPALATLDAAAARRVESLAGGLPRTLLLADRLAGLAGAGALADVVDEAGLAERLIDAALAAAAGEGAGSLAVAALAGAATYRVAVDETALLWQVGALASAEENSERSWRLARFDEAIRAARARGEEPTVTSLGLSRADQVLLESDIVARLKPPVAAPEGFAAALERLVALGLLERHGARGEARYRVAAWLAEGASARLDDGARRAAHARAAQYWHWRVRVLPRPHHEDVPDLVELRHHLLAAGATGEAIRVSETLVSRLMALGALDREERLCRDVLARVDPESGTAAAFQQQLGIVARRSGRVAEARGHVEASLALDERHGNRGGVARSWGELGVLASLAGQLDEADASFRRALGAAEEIGDAAAVSMHRHHLGLLARRRGALDEAAAHLERAAAERESAGDEGELADTLLVHGDVERARKRFDVAAQLLGRALVLARLLHDGDREQQALVSLGRAASERGQPEEAARHLQAALDAARERGDRAAISQAAAALGRIAEARGDTDAAWAAYRRALEAGERDGDREASIAAYLDLGRLDQKRGHASDALGWIVQAVAASLTVGSVRTREALDALSALARATGGRRWRNTWHRAYDADPPAEVIAWVEASWWRRISRDRSARAALRSSADRPGRAARGG